MVIPPTLLSINPSFFASSNVENLFLDAYVLKKVSGLASDHSPFCFFLMIFFFVFGFLGNTRGLLFDEVDVLRRGGGEGDGVFGFLTGDGVLGLGGVGVFVFLTGEGVLGFLTGDGVFVRGGVGVFVRGGVGVFGLGDGVFVRGGVGVFGLGDGVFGLGGVGVFGFGGLGVFVEFDRFLKIEL